MILFNISKEFFPLKMTIEQKINLLISKTSVNDLNR